MVQLAGELINAADIIDTKIVFKAATESITNNATLQNDDDLFATLASGIIYRVEAFVAYTSTVRPIVAAWTYSGTLNNSTRQCNGPNTTDTNIASTSPAFQNRAITTPHTYGPLTASGFFREDLYLDVATGGTIQLQWRQGTADAAATQVLTGSRLYITQMTF